MKRWLDNMLGAGCLRTAIRSDHQSQFKQSVYGKILPCRLKCSDGVRGFITETPIHTSSPVCQMWDDVSLYAILSAAVFCVCFNGITFFHFSLMSGNEERTFIAIKPDGVQRGLIGEIIKRFEQKGFKLVGMKLIQVN